MSAYVPEECYTEMSFRGRVREWFVLMAIVTAIDAVVFALRKVRGAIEIGIEP